MSIKSVVLAGAGGNLGPSILKALQASQFKVSILSRKSSKSTFPSGVDVIQVSDDYPQAELVSLLKGHDAVVSTITPNQSTLIKAAVEAGVKRFIPAEFGSDNRSQAAREAVPTWQDKEDIRRLLRSAESETFSWTAIANGPFFDWAFNVTKGGFFKIDIKNKKALVLDDGNHKWSSSNLSQVGTSVVKALEKSEQTKNKLLFIDSFEFTQNQLLLGLEKELGIKLERETVDGKKWFAEQAEKSAAGDMPAQFSAIIGWTILDGSFKSKKEYANELLGLQEENFEESVKKSAKAVQFLV